MDDPPKCVTMAPADAPIINGRLFDEITKYRVDVVVEDGKRKATGEFSYVVLKRDQSFDIASLYEAPFTMALRVGGLFYVLSGCCVTGDSLVVDYDSGCSEFLLKFSSDDASPLRRAIGD